VSYLIGRLLSRIIPVALFFTTAAISSTVEAKTTSVSSTTGNGTYICTPAGFGKKSNCFKR
jgi:hypothetical protein